MGRDLRRKRQRLEQKRAKRRQQSERDMAAGYHRAVIDHARSRRRQEEMIRRKEAN